MLYPLRHSPIFAINGILYIFSDWVYPPTAYTDRFKQLLFSGGADGHKLVTSLRHLIPLQLVLKP